MASRRLKEVYLFFSLFARKRKAIEFLYEFRCKNIGIHLFVSVQVTAFSSLGVVGHADRLVEVQKHFNLKFDMPCCLCCGDKLASPVLVTNNSESRLSVDISSSVNDGKALTCRLRGEDPDDTEANSRVAIESGETQKKIMQIQASGNEVCKSTVRVSGKVRRPNDGTYDTVTETLCYLLVG